MLKEINSLAFAVVLLIPSISISENLKDLQAKEESDRVREKEQWQNFLDSSIALECSIPGAPPAKYFLNKGNLYIDTSRTYTLYGKKR